MCHCVVLQRKWATVGLTIYALPGGGGVSRARTWHFELALIASFPGLISGHQSGMPLEGHVRAMEFIVSSQIHEAHIEARPPGVINQGTYIVERMADWISGPHVAWR